MNRCRTKFTCLIGYKQFRCHNYPELCEAYRTESRVFRQTRSPGNFASAFEVRYDFKGRVVFTKGMLKLCYIVVAKMPCWYLEWQSQLQLYYSEFKK